MMEHKKTLAVLSLLINLNANRPDSFLWKLALPRQSIYIECLFWAGGIVEAALERSPMSVTEEMVFP